VRENWQANLLFSPFAALRPSPSSHPMAHPSRRVPSPNPSHYYAVPQSPQNHQLHTQQRRTSRSNRSRQANNAAAVPAMPPRNDLAQGVATGAIGAGYGPYAVCHLPFLHISSNHIYYLLLPSMTLPQSRATPSLPLPASVLRHLSGPPSQVTGLALRQITVPTPFPPTCGTRRIQTSTTRFITQTRVLMLPKITRLPSSRPEVGQTCPF
jgi:hypothetical protein